MVIWLQGFNGYLSDKELDSINAVETSHSFSSFLTTGEKFDFDALLTNELMNFLSHCDKFERISENVFDVEVKNRKIRYVIGKASREVVEKFVIGAPEDLDIVITSRPNGVSKKTVVEETTSRGRLNTNMPLPKIAAIKEICDVRRWTAPCVAEKTAKALIKIITELVIALVIQNALPFFQ